MSFKKHLSNILSFFESLKPVSVDKVYCFPVQLHTTHLNISTKTKNKKGYLRDDIQSVFLLEKTLYSIAR